MSKRNPASAGSVASGMRTTLAATFAAFIVTAGTMFGLTGPAAASCAAPAATSAHAFKGTVVRVDTSGRIATVRTDDGRTVTVRGGPTNPNEMTSVDRTYRAGVRYEFHPVNDTDPFDDNICTATHELGAPGQSRPPAGTTLWPAIGVVAGIAMVLVVALTLRRRHNRLNGPATR